jgi:hypothetical protein
LAIRGIQVLPCLDAASSVRMLSKRAIRGLPAYNLPWNLAKEEEHEKASIARKDPSQLFCLFALKKTDSAKKPAGLSAKVAGDGKTLMADKDNKIWLVSNPETLSGFEGCHESVKAFVDVAQSQN